MTDQPKPSTADILAKIRGGAGKPAEPAAAPVAPAEVVAAAAPAEEVIASAMPAEKPKGTASILDSIRAGGAKPAAAAPAAAGEKPKSPADIMAAIRGGGAPAAKPAGEKPKSPAEIMASIRGGGAGAAAAKPVATAKVAATPVASVSGDKPSLQAMVKAVKEGAAVAPVAVKPKLPPKPVATVGAAGKKGAPIPRRSFFQAAVETVCNPFFMAWSVMAGIGGLWSLATARFMMPNMILELPSKFKIGPASDYPLGTVSEKFKATRGIWIVHTDSYNGENIVYALSTVCTHLGCTPSWLDAEQKFKCPCHGSGFYVNGVNYEGPAPRPLERHGIRVSEDGMLEVDKSVKFQEELGQWNDGKSFVQLS